MSEWTVERLAALNDEINALREATREHSDWCKDTPLGHLSGMDDDVLGIAYSVVHRLLLGARYPTVHPESNYLPVTRKVPTA